MPSGLFLHAAGRTRPGIPHQPRISNRHYAPRLETHVSHTKQRAGTRSNRHFWPPSRSIWSRFVSKFHILVCLRETVVSPRRSHSPRTHFRNSCRYIKRPCKEVFRSDQKSAVSAESNDGPKTRKVPFLKGFRRYPHALYFPQMNTKKKFEICLTFFGILIVSPDVGTGL
jgi:hypothetical protein